MQRDAHKGLLGGVLVAALLALALGLVGRSASKAVDDGTWTVALYLCGSNLESKQGWATKTLGSL